MTTTAKTFTTLMTLVGLTFALFANRAQAQELRSRGYAYGSESGSRVALLGSFALAPGVPGASVLTLGGSVAFRANDYFGISGGIGLFNLSSGFNSVGLLYLPVQAMGMIPVDPSADHLVEISGGAWLLPAVPAGTSQTGLARSVFLVAPTFGLGYRYWPQAGGLTARAALDFPIFAAGGAATVLPMISASVGLAI